MAVRPRQNSRLQFVLLLVLLALILYLVFRPSPPSSQGPPGTYLFCFWNVENLFDDRDDGRMEEGDREFDSWFARDAAARRQKLDHLSKALLGLNHGKGPDILAIAEVESERAAELLRQTLNARLSDPSLHYSEPVMKEVAGGRHIAPAILTRLTVQRDRTRLLNPRLRVLEAHLSSNGRPLVVLASHWTSRASDEEGKGRLKYADLLYGRIKAIILADPRVDVLVCGDFNDTPADASVRKHLHATGDRKAVLQAPREQPLLFSLFAEKDPKSYGTLSYQRQWFIFDQIAVSPGLLDDQGWSCDPDSVRVVNTLSRPNDRLHRPWRFGGEGDKGERGYSDHFSVTVQLRVGGQGSGQ